MSHSSLPAGWLGFLDSLDGSLDYLGPDELEQVLERWQRAGARLTTVGQSRAGRPIRLASLGSGRKRLLAWGYPHSDEPLGALALKTLGDAVLAGRLALGDWGLDLILCADPDQAARVLWLKDKEPLTPWRFVHGCWRPQATAIEVDYGFPLDWGPFASNPDYIGRCRTRAECRTRCGGSTCLRRSLPYGPLPESQALKTAIDQVRPALVAAMHNAGLGGDYMFLLERERAEVLDDLVALPQRFDRQRHLGEAIDRGRRWRRAAPDLIHEPLLAEEARLFTRQPGYNPSYRYQSIHSAGNYLEALYPGLQFVCPEVCHFSDVDFGDTSALAENEKVMVSVEEGAKGRHEVVRVEVVGRWVVAERRPVNGPLKASQLQRRPATRATLGTRAALERQRAFATGDRLWQRTLAAGALTEHPYLDERWAQARPGHLEGRGWLWRFQSAERYWQEATRAQAASFRYSWPFEAAAQLGNFQNFLSAQDLSRPELRAVADDLDTLQESLLSGLPESLQSEQPRAGALRSHLARLLRVMQEH